MSNADNSDDKFIILDIKNNSIMIYSEPKFSFERFYIVFEYVMICTKQYKLLFNA